MMVPHTSDHGCRRKSGLNLAGFLARSAVNGPGIRAVIWVQGCPIRCKGCFNPAFLSFSPAMVLSPDEVADRICALKGIDGVTFSGGEPFAQADALSVVGEQVRNMGYTIVTYTGYTYEHLLSARDPAWNRLLGVTDLLIAGPYISVLSCSSPFIGSSNQQLISLTGRIRQDPCHGQAEGEVIEFSIDPCGTTTITGFPKNYRAGQTAVRCREG
ncbi:4Fe-4S single cluster domain-containing protein [Methanoregula sp.]|uniref:4Fe-4S single cluster domain-containing protein n=1 Tax=Methanoregula sp. TaxID=2052170 RepID=UPI002CE8165C|nr:4Fe-4S single cluster domain-containing protein [Methanoregula sp.]HVP96224.1 4Fe-4S single cluster domain-containing protein [Methanoregula sp.]